MSRLDKKIVIYAVLEGLVLQPLPHKDRRIPSRPVKILFANNYIEPILENQAEKKVPSESFEAFGIIGLLTVSKLSFLISITRREQVAQIYGKPIYVVTEIALIPVTSKAEAESSIKDIQNQFSSPLDKSDDSETSDSGKDDFKDNQHISTSAFQEVDELEQRNSPTILSHKKTHSVAQDVIARRGGYGRFADKWFSKVGWTVDQRRNLGMTGAEGETATSIRYPENTVIVSDKEEYFPRISDSATKDEYNLSTITENMLRKLLRTTQLLLGSSKSFYFSYDWDITRSFRGQNTLSNQAPLHKQVLASYFWNRHLLKPFMTAGQFSFCLPLMQGFIDQREFKIDLIFQDQKLNTEKQATVSLESFSESHRYLDSMQSRKDDADNHALLEPVEKSHQYFLLTLISRRSARRAGLRYLRRGVDEEGFTANFVETEQILSDPTWASNRKISSFIQIRGSIPLFWSQLPYSFKPTPRLKHCEKTNLEGYRAHIKRLISNYGNVQIVSLVEKHGPEAIVGVKYEKLVEMSNEINNKNDPSFNVEFLWWDFHENCRAMKFEKVGLLTDLLAEKLQIYGYSTVLDGSQVVCQSGVLRTNCMDCLDRTNIIQSACARKILGWQLKAEGLDLDLQADQETSWFNNLWADNGDAISKQYASTSALKGDFARKRKREFAGALKDVTLSISRFCNGIFNDYFSQAAIDYILGNATEHIFEDFEERFMTVDPAVSMQRIRQQLIDLCQRQVIDDNTEDFICGWTLLTPMAPYTTCNPPLQESVLLITNKGLYSCQVDWNLEKLLGFERIPFHCIRSIKCGTYITSTLSAAQIDEERNFGLAITYTIDDLSNDHVSDGLPAERHFPPHLGKMGMRSITQIMPGLAGPITDARLDTHVLALKALPSRSSFVYSDETRMSEREQIMMIRSEIERLITNCPNINLGDKKKSLVINGDIISLDEAQKRTGAFQKLSHNIKKILWG